MLQVVSEGLIRLPRGTWHRAGSWLCLDNLARESPVWSKATQYAGGEGKEELSQGVLVGMFLGERLRGRVSETLFRRCLLVLLLLAGLNLIVQAIA